MKVYGKENFKEVKSGGTVFIANHEGFFDGVLIGAAIPFSYYKKIKSIRYMTYYKYAYNKIYGLFIRFSGAYPIYKKGGNLEESLKETLDILKNKQQEVLMFPQGKKEEGRDASKARPGLGYLAKKINPQIVPVCIEDTFKIGALDVVFRKRNVKIKFGKPFYYEEVSSKDDEYRDVSQNCMKKVFELKSND